MRDTGRPGDRQHSTSSQRVSSNSAYENGLHTRQAAGASPYGGSPSQNKRFTPLIIGAAIAAIAIIAGIIIAVNACSQTPEPAPNNVSVVNTESQISAQEALSTLDALTSSLAQEPAVQPSQTAEPETPLEEPELQTAEVTVVQPQNTESYVDPDTGFYLPPEVATVYAADGTYLGVEDPWVPSGYFTTGDYELDCMIKDYCDSCSSPDLDFSDNAYNTYLHVSWTSDVEREDNQVLEGPNWAIQYAKQLYWYSNGNCYEFSAFVEFVLKYFGYQDVHAEPCNILRQSGNWGVHGLTFVTNHTGEACFCDAALSSKGWMLPISTYTYEIFNAGQLD